MSIHVRPAYSVRAGRDGFAWRAVAVNGQECTGWTSDETRAQRQAKDAERRMNKLAGKLPPAPTFQVSRASAAVSG